MDQTMDWLAVYMSDEVTSTKSSLLGGTSILHMLWLEQPYEIEFKHWNRKAVYLHVKALMGADMTNK